MKVPVFLVPETMVETGTREFGSPLPWISSRLIVSEVPVVGVQAMVNGEPAVIVPMLELKAKGLGLSATTQATNAAAAAKTDLEKSILIDLGGFL